MSSTLDPTTGIHATSRYDQPDSDPFDWADLSNFLQLPDHWIETPHLTDQLPTASVQGRPSFEVEPLANLVSDQIFPDHSPSCVQDGHPSTFTGQGLLPPSAAAQESPDNSCTCSSDAFFSSCSQLQQHLNEASKPGNMFVPGTCFVKYEFLRSCDITMVARTCPLIVGHLKLW